jgi:hypothetical protein
LSRANRNQWTSDWSKSLSMLHGPASHEYCAAHRLTPSRARPTACRLYEHEPPRTNFFVSSRHDGCERMPGLDHPSLFLMGGKAAVLISQPYGLSEVKELMLWASSRPVTVRFDEWPSWHFPGKTKLVEVWASWAWDIAEPWRLAAPPPKAAAEWVKTWGEIAAKGSGAR